jgi:hypothetical protein
MYSFHTFGYTHVMDYQMIIGILGGAIVLLLAFVAWLTHKIGQLSRASSGDSLESSIISILKYHDEYQREHRKSLERIASLEHRMKKAIRKVSTVRFDPFEGAGSGKQSFAIALLDDEGTGAVVSSLHTRDNVRVFAKPISSFNSSHELSEEELRAIAQTR